MKLTSKKACLSSNCVILLLQQLQMEMGGEENKLKVMSIDTFTQLPPPMPNYVGLCVCTTLYTFKSRPFFKKKTQNCPLPKGCTLLGSPTHFRKPKRNLLNVWREKKIEMKSSSKQNAGTIITNKAGDNGTKGRKVKGEGKQSGGKHFKLVMNSTVSWSLC